MTPYWESQPGNLKRFMELWDAKWPQRAMARELGISPSTVWSVRTRQGLKRAETPSQAARYGLARRRNG